MYANRRFITRYKQINVQAPIIARLHFTHSRIYAIYLSIDFHCRVSVCDISRVYTFDAVRRQCAGKFMSSVHSALMYLNLPAYTAQTA